MTIVHGRGLLPVRTKRGKCSDAIRDALTEEEYRGYCRGCAIRALWQAGASPRADLRRARYYLNELKKCEKANMCARA